MGAEHSTLPPAPRNFPYFAVAFGAVDRIRIVNGDDKIIGAARHVIQQFYRGIDSDKPVDGGGVHQFKIAGTPLTGNTNKEDTIALKRTCCGLVAQFQSMGCKLIMSSDLSRNADFSTLFFCRNPTIAQDINPLIIGLSMSSSDKLQLVNAPNWLNGVLKQSVGPLIQDETIIGPTEFEVKIRGNPWTSSDFHKGISARRMLLNVYKNFDAKRFTFVGTANLKGTADTIFFRLNKHDPPCGTRYWILSLNCEDRLRLIDPPTDVIQCVKDCVVQRWINGLQEEKTHPEVGCHELKLHGTPWNCSGEDAVNARLLITVILQSLRNKGWSVLSALDVTRRNNGKSVFLFHNCAPASVPHFCLSPNDVDKLKVINGPAEVEQTVGSVIRTTWLHGIRKEGRKYGAYEWKLHGSPWTGSTDYAIARNILCHILNSLAAMGWTVVCSADVSSKTVTRSNQNNKKSETFPDDVHSIFFAFTGIQPTSTAAFSRMEPSAPSFPSLEDPPPSYADAVVQ